MSELDEAIAELERAAARLRSEEIDTKEAAELAERCARLARSRWKARRRRPPERAR